MILTMAQMSATRTRRPQTPPYGIASIDPPLGHRPVHAHLIGDLYCHRLFAEFDGTRIALSDQCKRGSGVNIVVGEDRELRLDSIEDLAHLDAVGVMGGDRNGLPSSLPGIRQELTRRARQHRIGFPP